ncbi:acyl carrier protein [Phreatobacter sp.]|uniref:acyl carrier protein n=1 Tax=Phreatobacter sp. TaxID=1966341 RepID=UPI003F726DB3
MHDDHAAVAGIIASVLGCRIEDVTDDAPVGSLAQWDSIAHLSIIMAFEDRLGRQLTAEETASLETVASFTALLAPSGKDVAAP